MLVITLLSQREGYASVANSMLNTVRYRPIASNFEVVWLESRYGSV